MKTAVRACPLFLILALAAAPAGDQGSPAPGTGYKGLVCRGVEESGRLLIGQPGFGPHLVSLFVTGPNPLSASQTLARHVAWVGDPLHSYVADGTGGLVIWAHPAPTDGRLILGVEGLAGIEVHYAGQGSARDRLWDEVLRGCHETGRPFLWGFAADDTHSSEKINLSWYAARMPKEDEPSLKAALRQGAFYVSNGPVIADIGVAGRTISLDLGQEADVFWLRAGQFLGAGPSADVAVTNDPGENRCVKRDRAVRASRLKVDELGLTPGEAKFFRAVVRTSPEAVALSQPWRWNQDGALENPYPPTGLWVRGQTHNHTDSGLAESNLPRFRLAYQRKGQHASFSTDYSYWESPYQWLPSDGTPQITSVVPNRCPEGRTARADLRGVNFSDNPTVQLGTRRLEVLEGGTDELRVLLPADVAPGIYDLSVTNSRDFRGCLANGFTVQSREAKNEPWRSFTKDDGIASLGSTSVVCLGDQVWAGSMLGVSRYHEGRWTIFGSEIPDGKAYAMAADPAGGIWVAGGDGLAFCDPAGEWSRHKVGQEAKLAKGRSPERWGRLAFDQKGQLWAANRWAAGLALRRDGRWQRLTRQDGLPDDSSSAAACDTQGTVWVGFGSGLYKLRDGQWIRAAFPPPLDECRFVSALAAAPDGSMWAAVTGEGRPDLGGVVHFRGEGTRVYTPETSPLPNARVRDVLISRAGDAWFASDTGVARLNRNGTWATFTSVNSGLGCSLVLGLAEDKDGKIWFATAGGVSCFRP